MVDRPIDILAQANEPAASEWQTNSILRRVDERIRQDDIANKTAVDVNTRVPAAEQAKAIPVAKENNIPVDVARRNLRGLEEQKQRDTFLNIIDRKGALSKLAADPTHGPIAVENADELNDLEQRLNVYKMGTVERTARGLSQSFIGGFEDDELMVLGSKVMEGTATPEDEKRAAEIEASQKKRTDYQLGFTGQVFQSVAGSAPGMANTMVGAIDEALIGGAAATAMALPGSVGPQGAATLPSAFLLGAGWGARYGYIKESYKRLSGGAFLEARSVLDANGNPLDAQTVYGIAATAGTIGALVEIIPVQKATENLPFLNGIAGKQGAKWLAEQAAKNPALRGWFARVGRIAQTGGAEAFAELVQEVAQLEGIIAAGGVTSENGGTLADQRGERYTMATVAGAAGGMTFAGAGEALTAVEQRVSQMRLDRADAKKQALIELGDKIRNSKTGAMSPETIVAHARQIDADGGGPQMSAPAEALITLFQSEGLTAEQIQTQFPEVVAALDDGAQSNAEVPLNAETIVKLAKLEGFTGLAEDIRTAPGEFTAREAKEQGADFDTLIADVSEEDQKAAVKASAESEVTKQMVATGMEQRVAETNARLHVSVLSRMSEASGKSIDALMQEFPLQIVREGMDSKALDGTTLSQSIATGEITIDPATEVAPVDITTPVPESVDWAAETRWVKDTYQGQSFEGSDGVPVRVSQISAKLTSSNMGDARKAAVLRQLPEIIKNAVVYNPSVPDSQGRRNLSYAYAASVVRIAGKDYAVALQYRVSGEGNRAAYQLQGFDIKERPGGKSLARPEDGRQTQPAPERNLTVGEIVDVFKAAPLPLFQSAPGADFLSTLNDREQALVNPIYGNKVPAKKLKSNEAAARWLEGNFVGTAIADFTKKIDDKILREIGNVMAAEAIQAMQKSGNAFDWYTSAMQRALQIVSVKWPLLSDDTAAAEAGFGTAANARFVFTYIMAVTSQNLDVAANAVATNKAFDEMLARVKAGDFTMSKGWGTGDKQAAMGENFAKFGPLIEAMPGKDFPEKLAHLDALFRDKMTVVEWVKLAKAEGIPYNPPGQTAMDAVVYGSSLLGPKIGNGFWQNLNGNFTPLTIDLWMRRTWGRLTGKSIGNESSLPAQRARLKASVLRAIKSPALDMDPLLETIAERRSNNAKIRALEARADLTKKVQTAAIKKLKSRNVELDDIAADYRNLPPPEGWKPQYDTDSAALAAYAKRLLGAWNKEYKRLRGKYPGGVPAKMQPTWARGAKRLKADLTTPLDQVANGTQRRQIETAVAHAQKTLADLGLDVTTADLQAILWYPEKELWGALTSELAVDEDGDPVIPPSPLNESYDTVFARILNAEGYDTGAQQGAAGDAAGGGDGGAVAGGDAGGNGPGGSSGKIVLGKGGDGSNGQAQEGAGVNDGKQTLYQGAQSKFDQQVAASRGAFERLLSEKDAGEAGQGDWNERAGSPATGAGLSGLRVFEPSPQAAEILNGAGVATPPIVEHRAADFAAQFFGEITASKNASKFGASVYVYSQEEYAQMRLFTTEDGSAGFAIKSDGDIVSVFSKGQHPNVAYALLNLATQLGGTKLDCFDTVLPKIYGAVGFVETGRDTWNEEYKPDGWDFDTFKAYNNGRPDVVYMAFDPAAAETATLNQVVQSRTPVKRGFIEIAPGRTEFKITLTGKADLSTFQHEAAHYYLEMLQALVERGSASPEMAADLEKIRAWMGLDAKKGAGPAQKIEVRHHEMFARGWEAYLMEGRAPSNELQGTFNRFRAWMVFVYKRMTALDVQLTDEVRSVFDRLVASDEAIAEARTSVGVTKPLPKTALYLSDDEYDRYVEAWNKANEEQQRELDGKLMREAAQETRQAWKEERARLIKEETEALSQTRGWRAWKLLSEGLGLEDVAPGRTAIKIDPETVPGEWRRDTAGMTEEGGLPFDFVAEFLGFNSGEEMISLIAGAKMAERDIPRKVIQQMKETHGHMDAVQLADAAIDAVHDDKGQEVLLTEYRAMAAKAGIGAPPKGLAQWMAAQASQKVMALTKRQLDPTRWRRAELSAAQKATAAKDPAQASIHKRQQMMARAMYKATTDASKRVDVIRNKLTPFTKNDRRAKLGKAGDLYLDGIDEILEAIQLKPMSAASIQKLDRLQKLVEAADKNGEPLVLPNKLRAMLGKKNFADMTLEELEGVHDAVMNIWHLAKLKNELKARNEKRQLDEALTEMEANAQAALGDPEVTVKFTKGWKDRAAATMRSFRAGLTKAEFLFGWLDGKPDGGLMHRLLYQPLADANKAKFDILKRFHETLIERMRNMPNEQKARWEAKRTFMGNPTANGATIISAALNLGNEGNKKKLLEGYGWNEQRLMAEINAFMTKADWDLVQHVWDEINTLWPKIEATTKAATGLAPKKVVAAPVQTPFGTYAGGYYPVVYDPDQTEQQFKNQQENAGLFTNNFARPTLGDGFTEGRVDYAAPILLELSVISRHLAEVVHYVTHYEAITQADKITRHPRFQAVVTGHMGKEFYRTIRPWLQDIARDQDTPAITKTEPFAMAMRYLRGGVSIGAMGYNIFTGVKQLMGVVQSLDAIGPKYWLSGLTKSWMSPNAVKNWKFAFANSQELEPLVTQFDRDIKMINDAYAKQGTMSIPAKVSAAAFAHIGWLQSAVNVATWHGAYEQEIAKSGDHDKAVMHADAVIRQTQSAGAVKDLSPIQRGSEINRAVSMFYSWFNVLYNRLEGIAKETKGIRDVPRAAMRVAILVMVTSMIEEAGRRAWEGVVDNYDDDDEERGYILSVLMKSADTLIGAIPLARAFISAEAATGGMKPEITPVGRVTTDYYRSMSAVFDLIANQEAPSRSEAKTVVRTISTLTQVPLSGPYNFLDELFGETVFDERKKKN
jgi:hypothetical protein